MTEKQKEALRKEAAFTAKYLRSKDPKNVDIASRQIAAIEAKLNPSSSSKPADSGPEERKKKK